MKIPIFVSDRLYIPRIHTINHLYEEIRMSFTYSNPKYYKLKSMNRYTGGTREYINTWEHITHPFLGDCITIPRGGIKRVINILEAECEVVIHDKRLSLNPITYMHNDIVLRKDQERLVEAIMKEETCLIRSPTGSGKCTPIYEHILMFDGSIKFAKDVKPGDLLMGPDSKPRTVLSTTTGYGPMYKIIPTKGNPWGCNDQHILVLVNTSTGNTVEISVIDYLKQSKWFKHCHKQFMTGVEFKEREVIIDPYFLGIWLGDGTKNLNSVSITKSYSDVPIIDAIHSTANEWNLDVRIYEGSRRSPLYTIASTTHDNQLLIHLRRLMQDGIRIPRSYLVNSTYNRMELLAGLIDTDGSLGLGYYEISQVRKELLDDIEYLARSLGFMTTRKIKIVKGKEYYVMNILGDIERIPVRLQRKKSTPRKINKDARRVGFTVESVGDGDYVGWTLDGDGRFLLGDFTVTHNTEVALKAVEYILKDAGPVLVIVWESDLMDEWIERASKRFGIKEDRIGVLGGGRKKRLGEITVGMQQTLRNYARQYRKSFGGIICDEVQRFAASTYQQVVDTFPAKYRIGISADETRKDGQEYFTYDMFGHVADEIDRASLIDAGKLHDVTFRLIPTGCEYEQYSNTTGKYESYLSLPSDEKDYRSLIVHLSDSKERNARIWQFLEPVLETGNTTLIITQRVYHAKYWEEFLRHKGIKVGLMIGGTKHKAEFTTVKKSLRSGKLQVGVGTVDKLGQALDIPKLNRAFVLTPIAGNKQRTEQVVGRLRRTFKDKVDAVCYYMYDDNIFPHHLKLIKKQYNNVYIYDDTDGLYKRA